MAQPVPPVSPEAPPQRIRLVDEVEAREHLFLLDQEDMPERPVHHEAILLVELLLRAWGRSW